MRKVDLTLRISEATDFDKEIVTTIVESFMFEVIKAMEEGNDIFLRGFGTFGITERAEKNGRNISEKTAITIPSHNTPTFKPCKAFKKNVKKSNPVQNGN